MVMFQEQNVGQNHNIKIGNKSLESVEQFEYLGTTLTGQYSIHEEIKSRLKSGSVCYHLVQCFVFHFAMQKLGLQGMR